jgi:pimeloyl-ACP methyl ester carboxylesterase
MALPLNHIRTGAGEPLLLLHGLGGNLASWSPVIEPLVAHREVVALDMPGFGRSPALPAGVEPTARNLCAAVLDFYDTLGLDGHPHLCGNSLGGWVAIECGRRGRARSVVGLCTAGFWPAPLEPRTSPARRAARAVRPFAGLLMASRRAREAVLSGQMRHPERVSRREAAELIRGYGSGSGYDAANAAMRAGVIGDVSDVEVPLTLAWADHDRLVRNRPLPAGILPPHLPQVVIPDAGHLPTWDQPELVTNLILEAAVPEPSPR